MCISLDYLGTLADDIGTAPLGSPGGCGAVLGREPLRVFWELTLINTICYVDGFNLYYRLLRHTPWKWLDIEHYLCAMLPNDSVLKHIKYFTARMKHVGKDLNKPTRQNAYLRALETTHRLTIIEGNFKKVRPKGVVVEITDKTSGGMVKVEKGDLVRIEKHEEKQSDVNIATHIMLDCAKEEVGRVVVVSNDTDLLLPISQAKEAFGKEVVVISPDRFVHKDLKSSSSSSVVANREILKNCQFPTELKDSAGRKITKPPCW